MMSNGRMVGPRWAFGASVLALACAIELWPRSQVYFGTTSRDPEGISTGIAWAAATGSHEAIRHSCQHSHKLQKWGWTAFDGNGGVEDIGDSDNNISITIVWDKKPQEMHACTATAIATIRIEHSPSALRRRRMQIKKRQTPDPTLISVFAYGSAGSSSVTISDGTVLHTPTHRGTGSLLIGASAASDADELPLEVLTHTQSSPQPTSLGCPSCFTPSTWRVGEGEAWDVEAVLKRSLTRSYRQALAQVLVQRDKAVKEGQPIRWSHPPIIPHVNRTSVNAAGNIGVLQFARSVPFTLSLVYAEVGTGQDTGACAAETKARTLQSVQAPPAQLAAAAESSRAAFRHQLCVRLGVCTRHSELSKGSEGVDNATAAVVAAALSNMLGSITYFHGQQLIGRPIEAMLRHDGSRILSSEGAAPTLSTPHGLLTGVPSRSFFPRGFLWDEGFHQLLVSSWEPSLSRPVLSSWLDTMDEDGWIAREQILGPEARSRVPHQFTVQRPDIPNPPAIVLPIMVLAAQGLCKEAGTPLAGGVAMADLSSRGEAHLEGATPAVAAFCEARRLSSGCKYACFEDPAPTVPAVAAETLSWLDSVVPLLARHFAWFKRTQAGYLPDSFRWRGATKDHNFASGLDDYPRGVVPHAHDRNVDLLSWMALFGDVLGEVAGAVGSESVAGQARENAGRYTQQLEEHWAEEAGVYCDMGVQRLGVPAPARSGSPVPPPSPPTLGLVCHVGYVSIMPLLLRRVSAKDAALARMLDVLADPAQLWSPYGLRSLSASSNLFSSGEDYWRGAVWMNMNWMAVAALQHYGTVPGPQQARATALADRLRKLVVDTVVAEYNRTGFVWENYDSAKGRGRGTHPFTGWSALVGLLVADKRPF